MDLRPFSTQMQDHRLSGLGGTLRPQTLDTALWILTSAWACWPSFTQSSHVDGSPGSCVAWRPHVVIARDDYSDSI